VVASADAPTERRAAKTGAQVAPELEPAKAPVLKLAPAHLAVPVKLPPPPKERTPLQKALQTEQPVEPKMVVAYVEKMDGLEGCAIMFGDGLNLAGQLPESYQADGLCAMAPSLMQRIENHMVETKLGPLRGMTLSCSSASITFFMHDNLCLAALHKGGSLAPDVRERLDGIVLELSKTYSQPA
jgi:predicted regulator of Ras-like GTPase activity (Roadblock/LC7/MglB family)